MVTLCAGLVPHVTYGAQRRRVDDDLLVERRVGVGGERRASRRGPPPSRRPSVRTAGPRGTRRSCRRARSSPARAPASIDMLQTVMRPSIERARIASPRYSMTEPIPPPVPMRSMIASTMSFAVTPGGRRALDGDRHRPRRALGQRLGREHVLDLAGADAEGERAERAVGRGVAVAADDGHPGLREPLLGSDDVDDALAGVAHPVEPDAELATVLLEHLDLAAGHRVGDARARGRRSGRCGPSSRR